MLLTWYPFTLITLEHHSLLEYIFVFWARSGALVCSICTLQHIAELQNLLMSLFHMYFLAHDQYYMYKRWVWPVQTGSSSSSSSSLCLQVWVANALSPLPCAILGWRRTAPRTSPAQAHRVPPALHTDFPQEFSLNPCLVLAGNVVSRFVWILQDCFGLTHPVDDSEFSRRVAVNPAQLRRQVFVVVLLAVRRLRGCDAAAASAPERNMSILSSAAAGAARCPRGGCWTPPCCGSPSPAASGRRWRPAPDLYKIATRKKRSVAKELKNDNWICSIVRLNTPVQLSHYLEVWDTIVSTLLVPEQEIATWKFGTRPGYPSWARLVELILFCWWVFSMLTP
jgi:hypothetical protein